MPFVNKVLVVDDDIFLANSISSLLKKRGIDSDLATSLEQAYRKLSMSRYEVIVLDRMLGRDDGFELISYIKEVSYSTKIMVLSQLSRLDEKLGGLKLGADEYLPKPCCSEEILLRLEHLMIMEKRTQAKYLIAGNIKLEPMTGKLLIEDRQILLRRREADILVCLLKNKNTIVTRTRLIEIVWGTSIAPTETTVDVYIRRLRLIIKKPGLIRTIRGFGYMLNDHQSPVTFYNY